MPGLPPKDSTASFWHSEPSDFLLGHQTTKDLPSEADVVIVGSGITGASAARYLQEDERAKDLKVVMLEAREACWGATGRNGGHCQPLLLHAPPDVVTFEIRNWDTINSYIEEHNVECEWRVKDACRTVWTESLAHRIKNQLSQLQSAAPELASKARLITDPSVLRREHKVNAPPLAMLVQRVASLWPYKLIAFILTGAIKSGHLNLQTNTPVTSLTQHGSRHLIITPRGTILARHVILATNGYTSYLLPEFKELIVPERGTMSALLPPKQSSPLPNTYGFLGANGGNGDHDDYLIQRPVSTVPNRSGHIMFGGGKVAAKRKYMDVVDDSVLDEGCAAYLKREPLHLLALDGETAGLKELEASHIWSGIWGTSRDRTPWVGAVPGRKGVWLAGGYTGHGMPNGTLCGKAVVEMVLGAESGAPAEYVEERLVRTRWLPESYLISEGRIDRCGKMDTVEVQEMKDWIGYQPPGPIAEAMETKALRMT